ncbi:MAG: Rab family GTPase [Candidatus Thorarchaeota archaeon]
MFKSQKSKSILLKIITCGEGGVGKTTLLFRYIEGRFLADTLMTIGVQFHLKELNIGNKKVLLQVWDFGGQDHFRPLLKSYAQGARGALLLFDLTRPSSLDNIEQWVNICREDNPTIPILFIGTKLDLKDEITIDDKIALQIKEEYGFFDYIKVSSKTGENVQLVFESIAEELVKAL